MLTVWCEGYDSPVILDEAKVLERIEYIYTNPQRANLVDKIEYYPNLNSWHSFLSGGSETKHKRIARCNVPTLPKEPLSLKAQEKIVKKLLKQAKELNP